jgi:hypothetical protein
MPSSTANERVRLKGPADLVAAVPHLIGFVPSESLVVMSLHGADQARVHLTMRFDLPPEGVEAALAADAVARLEHDGADQAFLACFTEAAGDLPRVELIAALGVALADVEIGLRDAVLVRGGTWRSYLCHDPECCSGPQEVPSAPLELASLSAFTGRNVLPDRAALVASLQPVDGVARTAMEQALQRHHEALTARRCAGERAAVEAESIELFRRAIGGVGASASVPTEDETARLVLALHDVAVRDEVLSWSAGDSDSLRLVLHHLVRHALPPHDAPACTTFAWLAYLAGDAAHAGIALERALATAPSYSLAQLLDEALHQQVHPRLLRALTASAVPAPRPRPRRRRRR